MYSYICMFFLKMKEIIHNSTTKKITTVYFLVLIF